MCEPSSPTRLKVYGQLGIYVIRFLTVCLKMRCGHTHVPEKPALSATGYKLMPLIRCVCK